MTSRLSQERLAQISAIPDDDYYMRIHPKPWLGNELRDLLAELREVTRERDEARAHLRESSDKDLQKFLYAGSEYLALEQERDRLTAELERERKEHGYTGMAADVEAKWADEFNAECAALRAENARLKAVADAAKTVSRLLEYSGLPAKEWRVNGHIALSTAAIGKLRETLAALDRKEGA